MTHEFSLVPVLMLGTLVSQAVRLRFAQHNFYEALLIQDGHVLEHVIPPRDFQSWQQLPVSTITNFNAVTLTDLSGNGLRSTMQNHPYACFPFLKGEGDYGIVSRQEAESALERNRPARPESATVCTASQTIRELQLLLMESKHGLVLVLDRPAGKILGLITLHDLLRAQVSLGKEAVGAGSPTGN